MSTPHVVVVGAGLSGLSAALCLAGAGNRVTVLEREPVPGGRLGLLLEPSPSGGYRLDTGPIAIAQPELVAECFASVGRRLEDYLELLRLDPLLQARFPDGTVLDLHADPDETVAELDRLVGGPAGGDQDRAGLRRYLLDVHTAANEVIAPGQGWRTPVEGLRRQLRPGPRIADYVEDDRLRRLYGWAMVPGQAPTGSPADVLGTHARLVAEAWVPRGGMHRLPQALARAATDAGVQVRTGSQVTAVHQRRHRVSAVQVGDDEIGCDRLVLAVATETARALLTPQARARLRPPSVPSAWLMLVGGPLVLPAQARHRTLLFGRAGHTTIEEITAGRLASDPTLLVGLPALTDPSVAPRGRHVASVLSATPHLGRYPQMRRNSDGAQLVTTSQDWGRIGGHYHDHIHRVLVARGFAGLTHHEVEHVLTPVDWLARDLRNGSPFGAAGGRTLPGTLRRGPDVVLAGADHGPADTVAGAILAGRRAARLLELA